MQQVTLKLPPVPTAGNFQVSPSAGTSMSTWFLFLACDGGWSDGTGTGNSSDSSNNNGGLQMAFYYWTSDGQRVTLGTVVGCGLSAQLPYVTVQSSDITAPQQVNVSACGTSVSTGLEVCAPMQQVTMTNLLATSAGAQVLYVFAEFE